MRKIIMILTLIGTLLLTGCWNYRELNEYKIVSGFCIDYDEEKDHFKLTIEVINSKSDEEEAQSEIFTVTGNTIFQGIRDMIEKVGRKLYWSHAQVVVVSSEIAEKGIISVLDFIYRDSEMRTNMWLLISKADTAEEVFKATTNDTSTIVSYHIDNIIKSQRGIEKYYGIEVWKMIKNLYTEGISPTAPLIGTELQNGVKVPSVGGTAVFLEDKMVGTLTPDETRYLTLIKNKLKGGILVVKPKYKNKCTQVALEVYGSKTELKASTVNNKIVIGIKSDITVGIGETGYKVNFISSEGREFLKKYTEEYVENEIMSMINKVQKKYHSDIFGFAAIIERDLPNTWKQVESNWNNTFEKLDFDISITADIKGSALINSPLRVNE